MKRNIMRTISIALILALCISTLSVTEAARSSDYIISRYASVSSAGGGRITVNYSITATSKMTTIGATKVEIKNSSGTTLRTYKSTDAGYEYMMSSNIAIYSSSVPYQGISGNSYYAVVYFKAGNSSGSDTSTYTTSLATA